MSKIIGIASRSWLHIGSLKKYGKLKSAIAHVCRDVTNAGCIDEICINDILLTFRKHGFEVVHQDKLK